MRILCIHNRYQHHGGEDQVFDSESALLEQNGHCVHRLEFDNDDIPSNPSPVESVRLAVSTVWSRASAEQVRTATMETDAEVVHFTNTFPLASPAVYSAAKSAGAAVVQTVQNYRTACPSSNFFRDHHVCEDCLGRTVPWPGVVHACYRNSRPQTAVVAAMITTHRLRKTWQNDVDVYVAATEFSRQKLIEGSLPAQRIVVKPNFLDSAPPVKTSDGDYCLFVGRLVEEKGIATMLAAWTEPGMAIQLRIAGTGPMEDIVHSTAAKHEVIQPLGNLTRPMVLKQMHEAKVLIFPSLWYEGLPVTLVEALACGLPVIASRLGAMAEVIQDGRTGLLFNPGDAADLAAKVHWVQQHPEEVRAMGASARSEYEAKYTPERNYRLLMSIYERAVNDARTLSH